MKEITRTWDNYNEIKQNIFQREKDIKARATEEAAKLINELDKHILPSKAVFMEEKQKIQDEEQRLKETNQEVATALQSHQATSVLATMDIHDKHLPLKPISQSIPLEQKFTFKVPDLPSINFGSVEKCPIFKVINTYETSVYFIKKLKSLKDGTLICVHEKNEDEDFFIGYCYEQDDKSYIIQNEIYVSSNYYDIDMTVTEDDMILINFSYDKGIQFLNAYDNELKTLEIELPPTDGTNIYVQTGIHFQSQFYTFDNSMLVGMAEFEPWNPDKRGISGLISFDENGYCQELYRIPDSDSEPPIIDRVDKFTVNINGDINIIGWKKLLTVSLLFGVTNVKLEWTWQNQNILTEIDTTPIGLIVVADEHLIHILSMNGDLLTSIGEQEGIHHLTCLHVNISGQLLVGCKGEKNQSAKIHVVEIVDHLYLQEKE